ncbi:MAG: hypothetical protein KatS3mg032_1367 [Cyclobacteriaceae bacterium]|nr:MAG: hypothetical protein KatS3mg032_1367 [Cyclobacteriaceae bacterium]
MIVKVLVTGEIKMVKTFVYFGVGGNFRWAKILNDITRTSLIVTLVILTSELVNAQAKSTKDLLTKFTKDYFEQYNNCNVDKILELCTDDIEVYHDLAGLINGKN